MQASIEQILTRYNDRAPLSEASTIPAPWYVDPRIAELERLNVFSKTWQLVAHPETVEFWLLSFRPVPPAGETIPDQVQR